MYPENPWRLWVNILSNIELGQLFTITGICERIQLFAKVCLHMGRWILCDVRVALSWVSVLGWNGKDCR